MTKKKVSTPEHREAHAAQIESDFWVEVNKVKQEFKVEVLAKEETHA